MTQATRLVGKGVRPPPTLPPLDVGSLHHLCLTLLGWQGPDWTHIWKTDSTIPMKVYIYINILTYMHIVYINIYIVCVCIVIYFTCIYLYITYIYYVRI